MSRRFSTAKRKIEYRSRKTLIRERVYLYTSLSPAYDGAFAEFDYKKEDLPTGAIVGTVEIVDCTGYEGNYEIHRARHKRLTTFLKAINQPQPMFWLPRF